MTRYCSIFLCVIALCLSSSHTVADTQCTATSESHWSSAQAYNMVYANDKFVSVGVNGRIQTSPNGNDWTPQTSGTSNWLFKIIWNDNQFIAVGENGTILTSPDAIIWSQQKSDITTTLRTVVWNGTMLVAAGDNGVALSSSDGLMWNNLKSDIEQSIADIIWNGSQFIAISDGINHSNIYSSDDAASWSLISTVFYELSHIEYNGSTYVTTGNKSPNSYFQYYILSSNDAITWEEKVAHGPSYLSDIKWANDQFLAVGANGKFQSSSDGDTWNEYYAGSDHFFDTVAFGNGNWVATGKITATSETTEFWQTEAPYLPINARAYAGGWSPTQHNEFYLDIGRDSIGFSSDFNQWSIVGNKDFVDLSAAASNGTDIVIVGELGSIYHSSNLTTWQKIELTDRFNFTDVIWGNDLFVAVGKSRDKIYISSDGIIWESIDVTAPGWITKITWNGSQFLALGSSKGILTSNDGRTWIQQNNATNAQLDYAIFADNQYVAVGKDGAINTSPDGISWTQVESNTNDSLKGIAWNGQQYLAVGLNATLLSSTDGSNWTNIDSPFISTNGIFWSGTQFVIANHDKIAISVDGNSWQQLPHGQSWQTSAIATNNTNHVIFGTMSTEVTTTNSLAITADNTFNISAQGLAYRMNDVIWDGSRYVAVGAATSSAISEDGFNWTLNGGSLNTLYSIIFNGSRYYAAASGGRIISSTDAINWDVNIPTDANRLFDIVWNAKTYVAVGNRIFTSTNGSDWTQAPDNFNNDLYAVVWGEDRFVAVGERGHIRTSLDGINWTAAESGTTEYLYDIAWNGELFVAISIDGAVFSSPDGENWTTHLIPGAPYLKRIIQNDQAFLALSNDGIHSLQCTYTADAVDPTTPADTGSEDIGNQTGDQGTSDPNATNDGSQAGESSQSSETKSAALHFASLFYLLLFIGGLRLIQSQLELLTNFTYEKAPSVNRPCS